MGSISVSLTLFGAGIKASNPPMSAKVNMLDFKSIIVLFCIINAKSVPNIPCVWGVILFCISRPNILYFYFMNLFTTNQNKSERIARFIISLFLIPAPFIIESSNYAILLGAVGATLLFNALIGTCMIYKMLGANTCKL